VLRIFGSAPWQFVEAIGFRARVEQKFAGLDLFSIDEAAFFLFNGDLLGERLWNWSTPPHLKN
jgi:hypothetical protein